MSGPNAEKRAVSATETAPDTAHLNTQSAVSAIQCTATTIQSLPKAIPRKVPAVSLALAEKRALFLHSDSTFPSYEYILNDPSSATISPSSAYTADWSSPESLLHCRDLPVDKSYALRFALEKAHDHKWAFSEDSTFKRDIGLISMSDVPKWVHICYCRPRDKGGKKWRQRTRRKHWRCKCPDFCPHCGFLRALNEIDRLTEGMYEQLNSLWKLTLSFSTPVSLADDLDLALLLFDALEGLLRDCHRDGLFNGVLGSKELAVTNLLSPTGIPHLHGLLHTDALPEQVLASLEQCFMASSFWHILHDRSMVPAGFRPSFQIKSLGQPHEIRSWLFYIMKTFSIAATYQADFAAVADKWALNRQAAEVLNGWDLEMTSGIRDVGRGCSYRVSGRVFRLGSMHWRSRGSITTPKGDWSDPVHRDLAEDLRADSKFARLGILDEI